MDSVIILFSCFYALAEKNKIIPQVEVRHTECFCNILPQDNKCRLRIDFNDPNTDPYNTANYSIDIDITLKTIISGIEFSKIFIKIDVIPPMGKFTGNYEISGTFYLIEGCPKVKLVCEYVNGYIKKIESTFDIEYYRSFAKNFKAYREVLEDGPPIV